MQDEETIIELLRRYGLLVEHGDIDPRSKCGWEMPDKRRKIGREVASVFHRTKSLNLS